METNKPSINASLILKPSISEKEYLSFLKDPNEQNWSESQSGWTYINLVSKSDVVTSVPKAYVLPHSAYLQTLVDASETCGCARDTPTVLLPDWDGQLIQALVNLLYSRTVAVTSGVNNELIELIQELRLEISEENLMPDSLVPSQFHSDLNGSENGAAVQTSLIYEGNRNKGGQIKYREDEKMCQEQNNDKIIEKMRYILDLLIRVKIRNGDSFLKFCEPLEHLLSSLKFLPTETSIDILPIEIKTRILAYLYESGTLVAATVCQEWRNILNNKLTEMKIVKIKNECSNMYSCKEGKCFMPAALLMAPKILNIDYQVLVNSSVTDVDNQVIAQELTSVSRFAIVNENKDEAILNENQVRLLFDTLEQKSAIVNNVGLYGVNMNNVDQDKLVKCLLNLKVLFFLKHVGEPLPGVEKLVEKLLDASTVSKLEYLRLGYIEYPETLSEDLADALCKIQRIDLLKNFPLTLVSTQRLIANILSRSIRIKELIIEKRVDYRMLVSPQDLANIISKLDRIILHGRFTTQQLEATRVLPGVDAYSHGVISKVL